MIKIPQYKKIAVIGGGMAGFMAALHAQGAFSQVTIFERHEKFGKKLYLTGNGKCNLSNAKVDSTDYVSDDIPKVMRIVEEYRKIEDEFWRQFGLFTKAKSDRIYPISNQASTVVEMMERNLKNFGIKLKYNSLCFSVTKMENGKFKVIWCDLENSDSPELEDLKFKKEIFDKVILCCGGVSGIYDENKVNGYTISKTLGIKHNPCYPALVQTKCKGGLSELAGVRQDAIISLEIDGITEGVEIGEIQFTNSGLSGIAVFQHTLRIGQALRDKKTVKLIANFLYDFPEENLVDYVSNFYKFYSNLSLLEFFKGTVNEKLILYVLKKNNLKPESLVKNIEQQYLEEVILELKNLEFTIKELNNFKNAQVSTGGVSLAELDENLMVKNIPGLYIAGEMLDVAGKCGGYNLLFAAASGYLCGMKSSCN